MGVDVRIFIILPTTFEKCIDQGQLLAVSNRFFLWLFCCIYGAGSTEGPDVICFGGTIPTDKFRVFLVLAKLLGSASETELTHVCFMVIRVGAEVINLWQSVAHINSLDKPPSHRECGWEGKNHLFLLSRASAMSSTVWAQRMFGFALPIAPFNIIIQPGQSMATVFTFTSWMASTLS